MASGHGLRTVLVGKKYEMVMEANKRTSAAVGSFVTEASPSGEIVLEDRDAYQLIYNNSFDPLSDTDYEVIKVLFPAQQPIVGDGLVSEEQATDKLLADRDNIESVIKYVVESDEPIVTSRRGLITRVMREAAKLRKMRHNC